MILHNLMNEQNCQNLSTERFKAIQEQCRQNDDSSCCRERINTVNTGLASFQEYLIICDVTVSEQNERLGENKYYFQILATETTL